MSPRRTIVLSDSHGDPATILEALADFKRKYGSLRRGVDGVVFAGDFLDRGPDPDGCLDVLRRHRAVMLVGNHDQAIGLGYRIVDQDADSRRFCCLIRRWLLEGWMRLAVAMDGVLVSHAGVSSQYQSDYDHSCGGDVAALAERLCREYADAVNDQVLFGRRNPAPRILDDYAPHRYPTEVGRPGPQRSGDTEDPPALLLGPPQVIGHRPPESSRAADAYRSAGVFQIDLPYHCYGAGLFRYAVIENGEVDFREGTKTDLDI